MPCRPNEVIALESKPRFLDHPVVMTSVDCETVWGCLMYDEQSVDGRSFQTLGSEVQNFLKIARKIVRMTAYRYDL